MKNQPKNISKITPLAAFCQRHKISRNKLSEIAGGDANDASKSTMQRLLHDEITDADYKARLRKILAENLPAYLFSQGLQTAQIDHELLQIFDEGEYQPMINQKTILPLDVRKFFGLSDDPFAKPPRNRQEVFTSPALKEVIDGVIEAIKFQGFVYVSGEIGSGKSTVRAVVEDYVSQNHNLRLIFPEFFDMGKVSPMAIARAILEAFEVEKISNDSVKRANAVKKLLASVYQDGTRVALGFDECHNMSDVTVSSLKNFLEMNSGGFQRYLGVVLFGQPSFEARLREFRFREIVERVTQIKMPPFEQSAEAYLAHRLSLVGGNVAELFDASAINLIVQQAKTPLALGNIVNSALIISKNDFSNRQVIGEAIKTKMYFASTEPKEFSKKKGAN